DPRKGQLLAEDLGELLQGQLDLEDVPAGLVAGVLVAFPVLRGSERLAGLALAHPDPAGPLAAVAELRQVDLRKRDRHQVVPLLADHLPAADVLGEVALDLPADQLAEPLQVLFDLLSHGDKPHGGLGPSSYPNRTRCPRVSGAPVVKRSAQQGPIIRPRERPGSAPGEREECVAGRGREKSPPIAMGGLSRGRHRRGLEGWGCPEPPPPTLMAAPSGLTRFTPSGRSGPHPSKPRRGD